MEPCWRLRLLRPLACGLALAMLLLVAFRQHMSKDYRDAVSSLPKHKKPNKVLGASLPRSLSGQLVGLPRKARPPAKAPGTLRRRSARRLQEAFAQPVEAESKIGKPLEFVHITKTGGSAIVRAGAAGGVQWAVCHYPNHHYDIGCPGEPKVPNPEATYTIRIPLPWHVPLRYWNGDPYDGADTFAVVRDPYDRAVSEYYNNYMGYKGEDKNDPERLNWWVQKHVQFVMDFQRHKGPTLLRQYLYIFDENDNQRVTHVLHFENLHEEFAALMEQYGLDVHLAERKVNARHDDCLLNRGHLDDVTRRMIEEYAAEDFEHFGYPHMGTQTEEEKVPPPQSEHVSPHDNLRSRG